MTSAQVLDALPFSTVRFLSSLHQLNDEESAERFRDLSIVDRLLLEMRGLAISDLSTPFQLTLLGKEIVQLIVDHAYSVLASTYQNTQKGNSNAH